MIQDAIKPYVLLGVALTWMASLVAVGVWQNGAGRTAERTDWQDRENIELREANAEIERLNREARDREADHAQRLADISTAHQKEIKDAKAQRDRDIAAARAGALRLRFDAPGLKASEGAAGAIGASTCRCDGGATGELRGEAGIAIQGGALPGDIAAALYDLAHDADDIARQLARAQQVIVEDRRLCSGEERK